MPLHALWASCVVQAGSLQRITTRSPLWAPLPYGLPLPSFSSLVITCSSFESGKRDTIGRLVVLLGAKYEDCLKRGATHLVVPQLGSVEGEPGYGSDSLIKKCQRAVAWKMCLVTPSWLVECAAAGQRLDEAEFFPPGELPAAATQGGALPSQLPVTQVRCCLHALARTLGRSMDSCTIGKHRMSSMQALGVGASLVGCSILVRSFAAPHGSR